MNVQLQKGDIILCANITRAVIFDIFIPGTYHHALIYVGNNMCIDFQKSALEIISIYKAINRRKYIKICRHKDALEGYLAVCRAYNALNKNIKYSIFPFSKTKYCFSFINYCYNNIFEKSKIYNYILASSILNNRNFICIDY